MPFKTTSKYQVEQDEKERILTFADDFIYGYTDVIEKVMHRREPFINMFLRRKQYPPAQYRIRNGFTKRMTQDEIKILSNEAVLWVNITSNQARDILGTDKPSQHSSTGNYLIDLRKYLGRHDLSYANSPVMYLHHNQVLQ